MRQRISGGSPFEPIIGFSRGFSRALRDGSHIYVSGTGPAGADTADAAAQTSRSFEIILTALQAAGAGLEHVVRTRIYLTHAEDWEEVAPIHGKLFGEIRPAATMMVVAKLLNPAWRVEIEADAVLPESPVDIARERTRRLEKKALGKLRNLRTPPPSAS